jgi:hypothetical protein
MAPGTGDRFSTVKLVIDIAAVLVALAAFIYAHHSSKYAKEANKYAEEANKTSEKALFIAELAPSKLTLVANDPFWKIESVGMEKKRRCSLVLIATITFSNQGAQQGCIADLAAVLQVPVTADQKKLRPYEFLDSEKLYEAIRKKRPIYESYEAAFAPIVILGKQQVTKIILFRDLTFDQKYLKEGTYALEVMGTECSGPEKWTRFLRSTYVVDNDQVGDLVHGQMTVFESEERIHATRALITP